LGRREAPNKHRRSHVNVGTAQPRAGSGTLYVTKSTAQSAKDGQSQADSNASPIYGVTIPAGYREWRLISVKQLTGKQLTGAGGNLKQLRAQLGNDLAIKAFRDGTLPFPDGAIIAALHWNEESSDFDNQALAAGFPGLGLEASFAGSAVKTQKSTPHPVAGDLPTSRTANLAMRHCTKSAFPATHLQKTAITFSLTTHLRPELNHDRRASH
jgi:hypothetical protein